MIDAGTNRFGLVTLNAPLDGNGDGIALPDIGAHEFLLESADSNSDGIPDGWTVQFGFYPGATNIAASDPDADQQTTFQEWIANTNPTNAASVLRLSLTSDARAFEFTASSNRIFSVQFTTNLLSPTWIDLPNTSGTVQLPLTDAFGFWRVQARLPEPSP
jgi:hypothetical protein